MKVWKILVLIPYILVAIWIGFWFADLLRGGSFGIVGIILYPLFILYGIFAAVIYSVILGIALLIRWLVKRLKPLHEK